MRCSGSSVKRTMTLVLILMSLFHIPVGSAFSHRQPGSPVRSCFSPTIDTLAFGSPSDLLAAERMIKARVSDAYGKLPLRFEANAGQADREVKFLSRGSGYNLFLTPTEAVLALHSEKVMTEASSQPSANNKRKSIVRMRLIGANPAPRVDGDDALPGRTNYFIGNDPAKWRRDVTSYTKVRYRSVYPGIDMVYYGNQQQLEYDFVVAKGGNPKAIKLSFDGVQRIDVDGQGDIVLQTEAGQVRQRKPMTYQEVNGLRQEIASRYVLTGEREVGFELGAYDRTRPLVIDPVLVYSTYLGGLGFDNGTDIAVDAQGNAYVLGSTTSLDFPTVNPIQPTLGGSPNLPDVFVAKLNREGSALIYSTYLGGNSLDQPGDIAVDKEGNAYVTGHTLSPDFPISNALQPVKVGLSPDAFVAKLNASGSAFFYSTYLGGSGIELNTAMAIDREENVYVTGTTASIDFPTSNPLQPSLAGGQDAFLVKLNSAGSALVYSTYLGGGNAESFVDIALGRHNNIYLVGSTTSNDFPTANPFQPGLADDPGLVRGGDAFLTKLAADGSALIYSTYLGGARRDDGNSVIVDKFDNAYVTGVTESTNFPTVNPLQSVLAGPADAYVAKFNRSGSALKYSTYLGGSFVDFAVSIALDARGNAYVTGQTTSSDFPTFDALQPIPAGPSPIPIEGFVTQLKADGSGFVYSTYLGGSIGDVGTGVTVDTRGNAYVVGSTTSADFPTTPDAFLSKSPGGNNGFIVKIRDRRHRHRDDVSVR
jgi:Beta-propeller repeat